MSFYFFAIIDLLSILPSLTVLNEGFKLFRILRLNRAFRTLRLLRYSKSFDLIMSVVEKERKPLMAVVYLSGGYVLLTALIIFQVEPESFHSFFDAIYWAVVTLTTVGYGDIYPVIDFSRVSRVIGMLSSFMGIAIVALPT
ncbi:MAG: potassium channel family protein [Bacillota bacterium]